MRPRDSQELRRAMKQSGSWQLSVDAAESYARCSRYLLEPWVPALLAAAKLRSGERVLDVACGTGFVTCPAARAVGPSGRVVGIDINEGMLAIARASALAAGASKIEWRRTDVSTLPFPDGSFDVGFCQQGLQFFPDRLGALMDLGRVLVPGGRVALSVWGAIEENPYFVAIEAAVRRHLGDSVASGLHTPHTMGNPGHVREEMVRAGLGSVEVRRRSMLVTTPPAREFLAQHLLAMPMASEIEALSQTAHAALIEELRSALSSYEDAEGMRLPCVVNIATGLVPG